MTRSGIDGSGEDGIAWSWIFILVFIFAGAILYVAVVQVENTMMTEVINDFIGAGSMSAQTANSINFSRSVTMFLPVIMLIGALLYGAMRGVSSQSGDSGIASGAFLTGFTILLLCCLTGFIMSFLGGTIIDRLYTSLDAANMIQGTLVSAEWNAAQASTMWTFINAYYFLCFLTPVLGLIVFVKSVVIKTYGNRYDYGGY